MTTSQPPDRSGAEGTGELAGLAALAGRHIRTCATGRSALALAAAAVPIRDARRVVHLPFYCCPSVAHPFVDAGFETRFYSQGTDLEAEPDATPAPGEVFLFIHWFGFPNRPADRFARSFGPLRPHVVEDCVPASLRAFAPDASPSPAADYTVYSFRKVLPVPDGALLASRVPVGGRLRPSDEDFVAAALASLGAAETRGTPEGFRTFRRRTLEAEARLDADSVAREASPGWIGRLRRLDPLSAVAKRRTNARLLASLLPPVLRPLRREIPEDAAPLCLPVVLERGSRDELLRRLRAARVAEPLAWDVNPEPGERFGPDRDIARRVVALPVGQEIDGEEVVHLAEVVRNAAERA